MKISYRREMRHNYLVVEPRNKEAQGYKAEMLAENHIQGLLEMEIKYREGQPLYYYDITSRQPLSRILEKRFITREEVCMILIQLQTALTQMEEFFLEEDGILLEPEYLYMDLERFQIGICMVPERGEDFKEQLSKLLHYILKKVDHKDREAVVLAYGLYQESLKESSFMEDLLLLTVGSENEETKDTERDDIDGMDGLREKEGDVETCVSSEPLLPLEESPVGVTPPALDSQNYPLPLKSQVILWMFSAVCLPAFLWGIKGKEVLFELRYVLLGIDIGLLVLLILIDILILRFSCSQDAECASSNLEGEGEEVSWRLPYQQEEDDDTFGSIPMPPVDPRPGEMKQETFQTTLLSDASCVTPFCRLISLCPEEEDISISYYPFVIGKHEDLADYVLSKDTVSRFHLSIERKENQFFVTDLNSTNGTRVNQHSLEANETVEIKQGDELYIADIGYVFS